MAKPVCPRREANHKERKDRKKEHFRLRRVIRLPGMNFSRSGNIKALCDLVRQTSFEIHKYHGHGHLEKVYENALAHRLRKQGLQALQQQPINVYDEDGTMLGEYYADLIVENSLIIELKTAKAIAPEHEAQILGYLKSSRIQDGLLINFGAFKFEIRKFVWSGRSLEQR